MTGRERILVALERAQPDAVPIFLRDLTLGMDIADFSTPEVCAGGPDAMYDAQKSAQSVIACWEKFGQDCVVGSIQDLGMDVEALGGRMEFPERGIPRVVEPPFADIRRFEEVTMPQMDRDGRLPGVLRAYEIVKAQIGDHVAVAANVEGPVTKAGVYRGLERLMLDMVDDPELAERLIAFATDVTVSHVRWLSQAGADFVFVAAASDGPAVISPEAYLRYTIPNLRRVVRTSSKLGLKTVFHPHGRFTEERFQPLVNTAIETGISGFQFGEDTDLAVAKEKWGERIAILGGVDIPTVLVPGPLEAIRREAEKCVAAGACGGGYIFMPSCSLHRGAPLEHVDAMVQAIRRSG